jgi:hypothetical protein
MSFLNQLKQQADAVQAAKQGQERDTRAQREAVEKACVMAVHYFREVAPQLSVLEPKGPAFTLDGKTPWPPMKLTEFRSDARKKALNGQEVWDTISMGWKILPAIGGKLPGSVKVNFPPDLERVANRLAYGGVKHERKDIRHPEKNTLIAYEFVYECEARGYVTLTTDHDKGEIEFRLNNLRGFEVKVLLFDAHEVTGSLLDELAKLVVGQTNRFPVD